MCSIMVHWGYFKRGASDNLTSQHSEWQQARDITSTAKQKNKHKRKLLKKIINISIHKVKKSGEKGNLGIFTTLAPILSISPKWTQTSRRKMRKESLGVVSGGCVERRVVVLHISGGSDRCLEASRPWVPCGEQTLCKWMLYGFVSEGIRCYDLECLCIFFCMVELHCAGRKP